MTLGEKLAKLIIPHSKYFLDRTNQRSDDETNSRELVIARIGRSRRDAMINRPLQRSPRRLAQKTDKTDHLHAPECTITSPASVASSARADLAALIIHHTRFLTQHTGLDVAAADEPRSVVVVRAVRWRSRRPRSRPLATPSGIYRRRSKFGSLPFVT